MTNRSAYELGSAGRSKHFSINNLKSIHIEDFKIIESKNVFAIDLLL
jgi:hypothetical protein